jgi:hypothetical protein
MPDPISLDRIANGSSLSPLRLSGSDFDARRVAGAVPPALAERELSRRVQQILAPAAARRRTKIWEFGTNLHCSVIGTCLSTAELRHVLIKLGLKEAATATEHEVHASGVLIAGKRQGGAKLLHKALDRRHRVAISQFERAKSAGEVRALWQEAVQRGEIPGAYWAALTHPETNDALVREIFSEVHMLSHLVGAANRADIRRLRQLEAEKTELDAKVARQQQQLRDAVVSRDATIRELRRMLEERIPGDGERAAECLPNPDGEVWMTLAADLKRRLVTAESRRDRAEQQLEECRSALAANRAACVEAEQRERELRQELEAIEASLAVADEVDITTGETIRRLNVTLLYVGGRQAQIGHLRTLAERSGAVFLHHDGGVEERGGLLPGLVSRADAVMFPVDCISYAAMSLVKRLCRQTDKPFVPLRSAGLAPFCAALNGAALQHQEV